jgi:hypothetical protein
MDVNFSNTGKRKKRMYRFDRTHRYSYASTLKYACERGFSRYFVVKRACGLIIILYNNRRMEKEREREREREQP